MRVKRNLYSDKRGDITITVLVIGVFVVCSLALASFYYSSTDVIRNPSLGLDLMEKMNSQLEKYFSPSTIHNNFESLAEIQTDSQGNNFFMFEKLKKGEKIFHVKYYLD